MNPNLCKAFDDMEKVKAILFAIEHSFLDIDIDEEQYEKFDLGTSAFYALKDLIAQVEKDLERMSGDEDVIDAIYAANNIPVHADLEN